MASSSNSKRHELLHQSCVKDFKKRKKLERKQNILWRLKPIINQLPGLTHRVKAGSCIKTSAAVAGSESREHPDHKTEKLSFSSCHLFAGAFWWKWNLCSQLHTLYVRVFVCAHHHDKIVKVFAQLIHSRHQPTQLSTCTLAIVKINYHRTSAIVLAGGRARALLCVCVLV